MVDGGGDDDGANEEAVQAEVRVGSGSGSGVGSDDGENSGSGSVFVGLGSVVRDSVSSSDGGSDEKAEVRRPQYFSLVAATFLTSDQILATSDALRKDFFRFLGDKICARATTPNISASVIEVC